MPANPRMAVLTVAACLGGAGGLAATAATAGAATTAGSTDLVTGIACHTWVHLLQRTLRPSGGKTAAVS